MTVRPPEHHDVRGRSRATVVVHPDLEEALRAEKAADVVGAERWVATGGHGISREVDRPRARPDARAEALSLEEMAAIFKAASGH